jgi:hypothetical protein
MLEATVFIRLAIASLCSAVAACTPLPDTATLPFAAFGTMEAAWAFAAPARTANDPVDAARAAAGVDYLAGELSSNPRWLMVSPLTKQQMLQARLDVHSVLGIAPTGGKSDAARWRFASSLMSVHKECA